MCSSRCEHKACGLNHKCWPEDHLNWAVKPCPGFEQVPCNGRYKNRMFNFVREVIRSDLVRETARGGFCSYPHSVQKSCGTVCWVDHGRLRPNHFQFVIPPSLPPVAWQPSVSRCPLWEVSRSHSDTPQSVGLFWTSVQPDASTSTWQHTIDRHPYHRWDSNPHSQKVSGDRATP